MTIDEFKRVDLRVGKVVSVERVEGSEKLLKLQIDLGEASAPARRQIVAGIGKAYGPDELVGKQVVVVANLESRKFKLKSDAGQEEIESQGMILAAHDEEGKPIILIPDRSAPAGSVVG